MAPIHRAYTQVDDITVGFGNVVPSPRHNEAMVTTAAGTEHGSGGDAAYPLRRTPTQDRANRQVERILDAACAEVVERGYDAASTSSIAKRAEIAVGSVSRDFPGKRALE